MAQDSVNDDALFAPLRGLGERLRNRKLSPVALTEAVLDRLQRFGPRLNATVTLLREQALKEARAADDEIRSGKIRGPLHGIPYGAKDLLAARGAPTTWGAAPFRQQTFDHDATVIRRLREAGAILVAKLAMVELAGAFGYDNADASFTGPCRNPWNTQFWAGGSSSGSGAAVAAGLVPFAIGSETSGSIITPAAFCGVSGLRPTYGRVSRHGAMALSWSLDKLGPMGRSADDCGLVLAAIAGRDRLDPTTVSRTFTYPEPAAGLPRRFRVGVLRGSTANAQPAVRDNFAAALKVLGRHCDLVEDVDLPNLPFGSVVNVVIEAEGACAFRGLIESGRTRELRTAAMHPAACAASATLAVDYLQAMRLRTRMRRVLHELYGRFDAIIAPSRSTVAYPLDRNFSEIYRDFRGGPPLIQAGNVAGQPALSIPTGLGADGLPTGLQLTGRAFSEERLLTIARAVQDATEWHRRRPLLPKE
jgi:aspartyl-tRNA(Asn)/glutamyl-tRNA(Gln) amidotransferase subunit A